MTAREAYKTGGRYGLWAAVAGLVVAYLMMALMSQGNMLWVFDQSYIVNLLAGAAILLLSGYWWGRLAGKLILVNQYNFILVGIICGMVTLVSATFLSGWVGFFQEGIRYSLPGGFMDYVIRPVILVMIFGVIPAAIAGTWMGWRIKKKRETGI